jgi:hypothetical protein
MYIAVCDESSFASGNGNGLSQSQRQSQEPKFKLYQNTIYDSAVRHTSSPINVLWPIPHVKGKRQTIRLTDSTTEYSSVTRSWNGTEVNSVKWSFTGSCVYVLLERYRQLITAPIVFMDAANKRMLPYNSTSFSPNEIKIIDEQEMSYTSARVFKTDPNSPENTSPIPIAHLAPTAPPAAPVTHASVKIVLADAIRKNEVCPITGEDISETNATVTSCRHVFTTAAITHWLSLPSSKGLCPLCRQKCS